MNEYILDVADKLSSAPMSFKDKYYEIPELENLPDGAYHVFESNKNKLKYNV